MARTIPELPTAATIAPTDLFPVWQGGETRTATAAQLADDLLGVLDYLSPEEVAVGPITPAPGALDLSGGATGHVLTKQADGSWAPSAQLGGGDMTAATYDPSAVAADVFARANHTGVLPDTAIAVTGVTQHQAALAIATSQLNGLLPNERVAVSNITQYEGSINHDATLNFVANEHIDHTSVTLSAGTGLTGGGDISASRSLALEDTAVTPDTYTLATITIDQQGRITAADNGTGVDATGARVPTATGALAVTTADHEVTKGVTLTTDQASAVFTIADDTAAGKIFKFNPTHDGATVVIEGGAGSIDGSAGGTATLINGGVAFLEVVSNAGTAPVCVTYGDVIHAPTEVSSTKTYDNNDSNQVFVLTSGAGTQTFSTAVASMPAGFEVTIINESGGNITIDGLDADHTLADNGFVTVIKPHTSLLAVGTAGTTVLDAA